MFDRSHTHQAQRGTHLELHQFQHARDTGLAAGTQRQAQQFADPHRARAQAQHLDHIGAAQHTAVGEHFSPAGHRLDNLSQHFDAALSMVELAPAVVGHVHHISAVFNGQFGVFRGGDALGDQWQADARLHPHQIFPVQAGLTGLVAEAFLDRQAADNVTLTTAVVVAVHRDTQRAVAGLAHAVEDALNPGPVTAHIQLEYQFLFDRCLRRFQAGLGCGRDKRRGAARYRGTRHGRATLGVHLAEETADRRREYRERQLLAEQCGPKVDVTDIDQHTLAQCQCIEAGTVAPQRHFRIGAAHQVIPHRRRQLAMRGKCDFLQRVELARRFFLQAQRIGGFFYGLHTAGFFGGKRFAGCGFFSGGFFLAGNGHCRAPGCGWCMPIEEL